MGLDMYLYKKIYVKNWDWFPSEERTEITVLKGGKPHPKIDVNKVSHIIEDVAYWRKANHIHQWFVDNCQGGVDDCRDAYVPIDKLDELLAICKEVKANHSLAPDLLSTQEGFFFGGTEYDEYYFKDIDDTIEQLEQLDSEVDYYYHSSW